MTLDPFHEWCRTLNVKGAEKRRDVKMIWLEMSEEDRAPYLFAVERKRGLSPLPAGWEYVPPNEHRHGYYYCRATDSWQVTRPRPMSDLHKLQKEKEHVKKLILEEIELGPMM